METINSLADLKLWYGYPLALHTSILVSIAIVLWTLKDIFMLKCPTNLIWLDITIRALPYLCWIPVLLTKNPSLRIDWLFIMMCSFCVGQLLLFNNIPMSKAIIADGFYMWIFVLIFIGISLPNRWPVHLFFTVYFVLFLFSDAKLCQSLGIPKTFLWGGVNFLASSKRHLVTFFILIFCSIILMNKEEGMFKVLWNQKQEMEQVALHDYLSGLYNRNILTKIITNDKYQDDAYIAYIDIDNFKSFNDTYGHDVGDQVIIRVASNLTKNFNKPNTYIIRQGGDEFFCIISKDTNIESSLKQIYKTINENETIKIGLSIGYTKYQKNNSIEQAMKIADNNLYRAKDSGKNKYCTD